MLTKAGAKLMDFGLAKPKVSIASPAIGPFTPSTPTMNLASLTSAAPPLTQKGSIVGTFQYLAPEVLQGAEADARSDLFSFGCVLYEMVTGRRAFEGKSQLSVFTAILEKNPEPVTATQPLAPPMLAHVVSAYLAKIPRTESNPRTTWLWICAGSLRSLPHRQIQNLPQRPQPTEFAGLPPSRPQLFWERLPDFFCTGPPRQLPAFAPSSIPRRARTSA